MFSRKIKFYRCKPMRARAVLVDSAQNCYEALTQLLGPKHVKKLDIAEEVEYEPIYQVKGKVTPDVPLEIWEDVYLNNYVIVYENGTVGVKSKLEFEDMYDELTGPR